MPLCQLNNTWYKGEKDELYPNVYYRKEDNYSFRIKNKTQARGLSYKEACQMSKNYTLKHYGFNYRVVDLTKPHQAGNEKILKVLSDNRATTYRTKILYEENGQQKTTNLGFFIHGNAYELSQNPDKSKRITTDKRSYVSVHEFAAVHKDAFPDESIETLHYVISDRLRPKQAVYKEKKLLKPKIPRIIRYYDD